MIHDLDRATTVIGYEKSNNKNMVVKIILSEVILATLSRISVHKSAMRQLFWRTGYTGGVID
jgi:hypothetical protein